MPATLIKQNMEFLKTKFPGFYDNITNPKFSSPDLEIVDKEKAGEYLLTFGRVKCSLHSRYNVKREMEMLFKPLSKEDNQVIVIFGLGYGHCIDYIRKKHIKYKRLVIFEPCTNILYEVLKKRDVIDLLGMKNLFLHLLNVPNDMAKYLLNEAMESKTVKILFHISYMTVFQDIYDNMIRAFKNERISMDSSINTVRAKSLEWNTQQLKTIQQSFSSAAVLLEKFKNIPGIVASAGPSLEKHFDLLGNVCDNAVIVAPGSSIRIFNAREMRAHIAMIIDSKQVEAEFIKNYKLNSVLVGSYRLHPDVYNTFPNKILNTVLSTESIAQYFYYWNEQQPFSIGDHPSVAMASVELLVLMGCNPIILVGQDLCYYENRNYAGDSANTISESQFTNAIKDVDIYGNTVYTNHGYKAMQNDLENLNLRYMDKIKIFNATEGGLNIHGIENVKFTDVYNKYIKNKKHNVTDRFEKIIEKENADFETRSLKEIDNKKTISDFFSHLLKTCSETEKMINDKEACFVQFAKLIERGVSNSRINGELQYIQGYNKKLNEIPFFKQVVYPNIEPELAYHRASSKHIADSGENWEGAAIYERRLDDLAFNFVNVMKTIILREMIGDLAQLAGVGAAAESVAGVGAGTSVG